MRLNKRLFGVWLKNHKNDEFYTNSPDHCPIAMFIEDTKHQHISVYKNFYNTKQGWIKKFVCHIDNCFYPTITGYQALNVLRLYK